MHNGCMSQINKTFIDILLYMYSKCTVTLIKNIFVTYILFHISMYRYLAKNFFLKYQMYLLSNIFDGKGDNI